jgi:pimeloyl-ACP methyl ester carboxylesterase
MKEKPLYKSEAGRQAILNVYDSILQRWPVAYQTKTMPTRAGETFVIECGGAQNSGANYDEAPPIILIHGSATNSAMWIGDCAIYSPAYHIYALDIPGEPGKSSQVRGDLTSTTYSDWLEDIFKELNIKKATLLGLSLGGWMALKFATTFPERVEKLVLLCPAGIGNQRASFMLKVLPLLLFGDWGIDRIMHLVNGNQPIPQEAIDYTRLINKNFNPRMSAIPLFSDEDIRRLTMPVLLLVGGKDQLLNSRQSADRLKKLIPHAQVHLIPDMGHVLINLHPMIYPFLTQDKI